MLKLYRLTDDEFITVYERQAIYGNRLKTIQALVALGVAGEEVEDALASLMAQGHQVAHFGVNMMFIFSRSLADERKAG